MTVAVRTTESLGVAAVAAGINCDYSLGDIGPFQAAIPVGPVVVPVYATLPARAGIHLNGTLNAGVFNIASTTVASIAAGRENSASLSQQGTNVWISGAPSITGSAKLSASIGIQAGIGVVKGGNVHLQADFGPELSWSSGRTCDVTMNLGALSAGINVFGKSLDTPAFKPFRLSLWSGCHPPQPGSGTGSGSGGGPATPPSPKPSNPTPPAPPPPPASTYSEQQGSLGANTFTNPYNASGMGTKIQPYQWVQVSCKLYAPQIQSANPDGYWYRIASPPWNNAYYAVANTFWNGDIPGQKPYVHNTDFNVRNC